MLATLLHIIWPPFTFSTTNLALFLTWSTTSSNYQFAYQNPKVAQVLRRTNTVFSLLTATGANKTTLLHVGTSCTCDIGFYSKGNVSATHQIVCATESQNCMDGVGLCPLQTPFTGGHTFKILLYLIFRAKGG